MTLAPLQVEGMLTEAEVALLQTIGRDARLGIVEIGSYRGRSTIALASQASVPVYAVDPHEPFTSEDGYLFDGGVDRLHFMRNVVDAGVAERVRLINLASLQAVLAWDRAVDVLFIDGDHREAAVRADVRAWLPFVMPGGQVLLHDRTTAGVVRALDDLGQIAAFERLPDVDGLARFIKLG